MSDIPLRRLQAFGGDSNRKAAVVAQVEAHAAAKEIVPGPGFWDGRRGSLVGVAAHDADMAAIERECGIDPGLLFALEAWWRMVYFAAPLHVAAWSRLDSGEVEQVRRFPVDWLAALAPGADTRAGAREILLWCLYATLGDVEASSGPARELGEIVAEMTAMYGAEPAPGRDEWRQVRKRAVGLNDRLAATDSVAASAAAVVETAAWPIGPSGSTVADVVEGYVNTAGAIAMREEGWTRSDEDLRTELEDRLNRGFESTFPIADEQERMAAQATVRREHDASVDAEYPGFRARTMAMREAVGIARWNRLYAMRAPILAVLEQAPRN